MYNYDDECEFPFIDDGVLFEDFPKISDGDFEENLTQEEYDYSDYLKSEDFSFLED